jgi:hypothetical protein
MDKGFVLLLKKYVDVELLLISLTWLIFCLLFDHLMRGVGCICYGALRWYWQ